MPLLSIRPLVADDLPTAFVVVRQLRAHLTFEEFQERFTRQQQRGYFLVGAFTDRLVGVLGMRPVETFARGPHVHVDDLVVEETVRGQGVGRELLAFAERYARERGWASVFLDSRREVLEFYQRLGYVPHTAVLVRKRLDMEST